MKTWRERVLNNRGVALITVILIVGVLVAFAIELNRSARAEIYDAASVSDGIKLAYIAKSGVYGAVALLTGSETEYDTLFDDWANMEVLSAKSKDLFENGYFIVKVEDEMGKIPLNKLVKVEGNEYVHNNTIKDILLRLLSQPEFALGEEKAEEIVGAIKDWIDADDE
ncbi:MAG: type II secretion system protein GspK, partial [Smithellaceae bacterium]|nr:type II secretion system protein GspK [Smithellaceae bacterium]